MMRVVIDTNILVRAVIKPQGTVGPVLLRLRDGEYTMLYSEATITELVDVLNRPRIRRKYGLNDEGINAVVGLILLRGENVVPDRRITVCRDPRDDKFLEVAVAGRANMIVSGDEDLLVLHPFEGIPVVLPREFLSALDSRQGM